MSLKYLWNKLEDMSTDEQYAYIQNVLLRFQIVPKFDLASMFEDIPGKQSKFKNPLGYLVMHLTVSQLNSLIPEYYRELTNNESFITLKQHQIIRTIQSVMYCLDGEFEIDCVREMFPRYLANRVHTDEMLDVFTFGVGKYSPWSFLKLNPYSLVPALFRHLYKYQFISKIDEETGVSHLAHAACNVRMIQLIVNRRDKDAS